MFPVFFFPIKLWKLIEFSFDERIELIKDQNNGQIPEELSLMMSMMDRALNLQLSPSLQSCSTMTNYPQLAAFSECLRDFGGNTLLDLARSQLPLDSSRACRARAPAPIVNSGVISWVLSLLLKTIVNHGPPVGNALGTTGIVFRAGGKLAIVALVESSDCISLAKAINHDSIGNSFTGFVTEPTEEVLSSLGEMTPTQVNEFLDGRPMVASASVTIFSGVCGSASAPVMVSYINTLGTADVIELRRQPLLDALKSCAACLVSKSQCIRRCDKCHNLGVLCHQCKTLGILSDVAVDDQCRPCFACLQNHDLCIIGQVLATVSDCESGTINFAPLWTCLTFTNLSYLISLPHLPKIGQYTLITRSDPEADGYVRLPDIGHLSKLMRNG